VSTSPYADLAQAARLFADAMEKLATEPAKGDAVEKVYTMKEAGALLRLSKAHIYEQAKSGALKVLRIGRSVRIPASELEAFRRRRLR
jgi:excisionase family DNA binding protein